MMLIGKSFTFHAAHRLLNHEGKCHNVHGHTYKVDVTLAGPVKDTSVTSGPDEGMVLDFERLKEWWAPLYEMLDHTLILNEDDPLIKYLDKMAEDEPDAAVKITTLPMHPTAENLAEWLYESLSEWCGDLPDEIMAASVRVWETPTSWAEA